MPVSSRYPLNQIRVLLLSFLSIGIFVDGESCDVLTKPNKNDKLLTARWMVHTLNWGVVSTISTRSDVIPSSSSSSEMKNAPIPFGNVFSFSDGTCEPSSSTGIPYLYATDLDQTMHDVEQNPIVSLTLSEASISSFKPCSMNGFADPENPPCARLVMTGRFVKVTSKEELKEAKQALFTRHPAMANWPTGHDFFVGKIEIDDLWLLDWFGGASILNVNDYYNMSLGGMEVESSRKKKPKKAEWKWEDLAKVIHFGKNKF